MINRDQLLVVGLVMLVALLDCGQSQDGLRFPNIFGGLTNFFRQATQQQPQQSQQRPVNSQVSPGSGVGTTFPFLQAPPPAFQQPPPQQQQQQLAPVFFQNPGGVQSLSFQQPQPVAGAFTPSIPFQPQQQQQPPWPFATANSNAQVPTLLPIGNIPLQNTATRPAQAPIPAQFALSENTLQQQQQSVRQGKSILNKPDLLLSTSTKDVIDCGAGNDLGFCAISEKYPRQTVDEMMHQCHDVVRQMYAEVPEDYDALEDSHRRADTVDVTANQHQAGTTTTSNNKRSPWSWSTYRKESACDSELRFITPQVAQDRNGRWRVIVQTDEFPQRVAIDVCRNLDGTCKVLTDCGRKSRCVQRYSFQPLISLDPQTEADQHQGHLCPSMAVFRFPTSCVCHVEIDKPTQRLGQSI